MKSRWLWLAAIVVFALPSSAPSQPAAPQNAEGSTPVITKETRLVLVDTVVTDKKGNYIRDLTQKDFKVWEDNKEQPIKTFSYEAGTAGPSGDQKRYLVLFFDNSDMNVGDQATARTAALKFLDSNTSANRYIAIANFGGTLQITQNFTNDADRLKDDVRNLKFASVSPGGASGPAVIQAPMAGIPQLASASADFGVRTVLLALRNMAKGLANVPGRKSLVFLSAGFPINQADSEIQAELMAALDACNKSNVAIYPIDVRGVGNITQQIPPQIFPDLPQAGLMSATLNLSGDDAQAAHLVYVQRGGAGGGGGTGGGHGGTGGTTGGTGSGHGTGSTGGTAGRTTSGGTTGTTTSVLNAPYNTSHNLIPTLTGAPGMQQVLYLLAAGTGGFVIVNSNDLLGGLQKIAQEQNEYYVVGYTPPVSDEGSCHTLRVKVDRGDTVVRSRSGYCNVRPTDLLAGKPVEKQLENDANGSQPGNVAATMLAPYFYVSPNVARVDLAVEIPASAIKFSKEKGKQHAEINVLGLALKPDGTVAARFSDTVDLDFDGKEQMEEFAKKPYHYENQFEIGAGQYDLKVVFSSGGESFGKMQMPLVIDTYDAKELSMSAVALSRELHPLNQAGVSIDADLLEDHRPLVAQGMEIVPTGNDSFKKSDVAVLYAEIYDPSLTAPNPADLRLHIQVTDRKTGEKKVDIGGPVPNAKAGNPVIPIGVRLPFDKLAPGSYQVEIRATDAAGNSTPVRSANFELQ